MEQGNRASRLYEILLDGHEWCGFDLRPMLGTMPMRAANELNKKLRGSGAFVRRVRMHRHGEASWAVYRLERMPLPPLPVLPVGAGLGTFIPADPKER